MKTAVLVLGISTVALAFAWATDLVEFTYFNVAPNEPLQHPCKVQIIDNTNMLLDGGEMISFRPNYSSDRSAKEVYSDISNQVSRSDFQIDIETNKDGMLDIFVRHHRKFRDTVPPFVIPVIRKTVGRDQRELIAYGAYLPAGRKSNGPPNGTSARGE